MNAPVSRVARSFGAAEDYHARAIVQRTVAGRLAESLFSLPMPRPERILEIGCGSGFLGQELIDHWPESRYLFSDLSPAMVARSRACLPPAPGRRHFVAMDGEAPAVAPGFELIVSSMAFQWFSRPQNSLKGLAELLRPGGRLAFASLGPETFHEWRRACAAANLPCGTPDYPDIGQWRDWWPGPGRFHEETLTRNYPSGLDFLRDLKAVGAHTARADYHPQAAGELRRLLRSLDRGGDFAISYHLQYAILTRASP
ncbi:MAG: methyltransferase domain-containing protein [Magnetococcales bacterium]|nr:methyltransferase domain-containing protein [Magnetococcales bacterium]